MRSRSLRLSVTAPERLRIWRGTWWSGKSDADLDCTQEEHEPQRTRSLTKLERNGASFVILCVLRGLWFSVFDEEHGEHPGSFQASPRSKVFSAMEFAITPG
jgi:hypothetical protein